MRKSTKPIYYLASPYSHNDAAIRKHRTELATEAAVQLLHLGIFVFAPIPYNEPWEKYNLPGDWNFWADFDKSFVERCDGGLIVLMLDGWQKSTGVTAEIEFAKSLNLPVYYATPEQIAAGDTSFMRLCRLDSSTRLFCEHQKF
jgi:hypothetical protein